MQHARRRVALAAALSTIALVGLAPSGALAASGGYGPPTGGGGGGAPGFGIVLGAKTICASGGSLTVHLVLETVTITVPPGAFGGCALIEVTLPLGTRRPTQAGLTAFPLIFGVEVLRPAGGGALPGPFPVALGAAVRGPGIGSRSAVMTRTAGGVAGPLGSQFNSSTHTFSFSFAKPGDFCFYTRTKGT
ncbi:MAG TPA: hypothetical protein VIJ51_15820 [Solirubrobacteraceae bacterium]